MAQISIEKGNQRYKLLNLSLRYLIKKMVWNWLKSNKRSFDKCDLSCLIWLVNLIYIFLCLEPKCITQMFRVSYVENVFGLFIQFDRDLHHYRLTIYKLGWTQFVYKLCSYMHAETIDFRFKYHCVTKIYFLICQRHLSCQSVEIVLLMNQFQVDNFSICLACG